MVLWGRFVSHVLAELFLQRETIFGGSYFLLFRLFFSLQMFVSDHGWRCIPVSVKSHVGELISTLLKAKADSTIKRCKKEI